MKNKRHEFSRISLIKYNRGTFNIIKLILRVISVIRAAQEHIVYPKSSNKKHELLKIIRVQV